MTAAASSESPSRARRQLGALIASMRLAVQIFHPFHPFPLGLLDF